MSVIRLVEPEPKSRAEMLDGLRGIIREGAKDKIEYLEVIYKIGGEEKHKIYIDGVYRY